MSGESAQQELAVSAQGLGKCYNLYARPQDRLKQALFRWRKTPYYREFWALRGVSLKVRRGECLGIIGRNGSGKSTLLQVIAGTLAPNEGEVQVNGKVAALLELGSSFNPDFTGRENVFMTGAVLGIPRAQMQARFEEIATFAEIGDFIDQPVKVYSSGMFLRLAFAANVIVEPEILIVDEALAVGDAGFQMKCYNRMKQLSEKGTAIILVTHETAAVRSFCDRAVWLHQGTVRMEGTPLEVTSEYVQFLFEERQIQRPAPPGNRVRPGSAAGGSKELRTHLSANRQLSPLEGRSGLVRWGSGDIVIRAVTLDNGRPGSETIFEYGDRIHIEFEFEITKDVPSTEVGFGFAFRNLRGLDIITSTTYDAGRKFPGWRAGQTGRVAFELENILAPGDYALVLSIDDRATMPFHYYDFVENACLFKTQSVRPVFSLVLPPVEHMVAIQSEQVVESASC